MMNVNEKIEAMKVEVAEQVEKMTVADMRKAAAAYGIKNAKQYKRAELAEKLVAQMTAVQESSIKAEAEAQAEEQKAIEAVNAEQTKKVEKKAKKEKKAIESKDKRYKADKLENDQVNELVDELVSDLLAATPDEVKKMNLYDVNRKVLIEVMKQLHCKLWYRTYDKPTMIAKITFALSKGGIVKVEKVEVSGEEESK